jgi:hypothetical protein
MKPCAILIIAALAGALATAASAAGAENLPPEAAPTAAPAASSWSLGGSLSSEPYAAYAGTGGIEAADLAYGSTTTLGLDLEAKGDRARAEASLETAVLTGFASRVAWAVAGSPFARPDELLLPAYDSGSPVPETIVAARIRTLYLKLDFDRASLTAGRQVVNYGRGALWSPTDIFTELDLTGLSPVRRGSDALRLVMPLGATEGCDIVAAPGAALADGRYALRLRGLLGGVDGAVMAARDGAGTVLGADIKADLEIGFYGEAAYELHDSGASGTLKAAAGADYSFGDFIVAAEYYYNGGGEECDPLFPGSHNAYGSITWRATELFALTGSAVWDASGGTGTGTLLADISATQNATFDAFLQCSYGGSSYGLAFGSGIGSWVSEAGLSLIVKF